MTKTRLGGSQGGPYSESIWVWDIEHSQNLPDIFSKEIKATKVRTKVLNVMTNCSHYGELMEGDPFIF